MTFQRLIGYGHCLRPGCDWTPEHTDPRKVDLAARKHMDATGHPVASGSHPEWSTKEKT